ncbi:MAG TPA: DUF4377 domain-containing protein [Candidatus Omnitrophota bacterium]|nr:DUF4377 domain-containing protein [Candidatus Omnitrophota bacterium]
MKKYWIVLILVTAVFPAWADEEKLTRVHKIFDLPGVFSRDGVLQESIGVETLAGIASPVLKAGQSFPASAKMKFGISADCQCAKFRLFRMPANGAQPPVEISYDAVRGFSSDNKTLEILFEITDNRKVKLSVEVAETILPGQLLEWVPAKEIVSIPQPKVEPVAAKPVESEKPAAPKAEAKVESFKIASAQVDCMGVAPMKCLSIQREGKTDWENFYDSIQGFDYEPGFDYEVKVKVTPVENPPADASSLSYALEELVAKVPAVTEEEKVLHDIWVLKSADSKLLNPETLKNKPVLELHVKKSVYIGQAPCNRYSGGMKVLENNAIKFESAAVTRMACDDLAAETDYFALLERVDSYRREGLELILIAGDLEVLRFKKVD